MSRRKNNEGTIKRRVDGRWEAQVTLPDGKRKSFYGSKERDVLQKIRQVQRDIDAGLPIVEDKQTIAQYLTSWLDTIKLRLKPSSHRRYTDMVFLHIVPNIGTIPLTKLAPQRVQQLYTSLVKGGMSPSSVQLLHVILHRALKDALRLDLLQRNVTEMVHVPRREHHEMVTLSEEQVRQLLTAAQGHRFEALYVLAVSTGLRRGELLGLRWDDVDLDRAFLVVRRSVQREENQFVLADTKTTGSRRRVAISHGAVQTLRAHRQRQFDERRLDEAWNDTYGLVFPNALGKIMKPSYVSDVLFSRLLTKAGLPHMRFHDLRHTAATLLLGRGINPKVVSEMLGHSQISITLDIYSHVTPHMQEAAAQVMDEVFKEKNEE